MRLSAVRGFLQTEAAAGVVLMVTAAVAMLWANSPLAAAYEGFLHLHLGLTVGGAGLDKPLHFWINDGLMTIFFLLVGLEIKREVMEGELSTPARAALPGIAAVGGMAVPALVYVALNYQTPQTLHGWAIPAATDIAFAVGVLALLGSRVPQTLRIFLLALAIMDDLGAIVIIAVFYSADLNATALGFAAVTGLALGWLTLMGVRRLLPYMLLGVVLWVCVLMSGVHATLAGVALAIAIPLKAVEGEPHERIPLHRLEHALHPWVAYAIMPLFALANAGVPLEGVTLASFAEPVPLGIALGLFVGKQVGVLGATWLAVRLRLAPMPEGTTWMQFYGVALLTGIGFTMSLFIGALAFADPEHAVAVRLGVLTGSIASAVVGYAVLRLTVAARPAGMAEPSRSA
ncbi:Na+/H+ antiporter NhaA [Azospirillum sp.]|uniref:Na+/H+ antiporter NhaA n=1 Tax=Azospirillum sp. TaxID=34012 RepID=UPI002D748DE0|nr:Na+/H+ antiporter NhaA [Azospirillum sp.]HYD69855.1 Na+/H+ antiporter NhaA [Azospirillum sp.]